MLSTEQLGRTHDMQFVIDTKFDIGDKALLVHDTSERTYYTLVKILKVSGVVPDADEKGSDIVTYKAEVYAPSYVTEKANLEVSESDLISLVEFEAIFNIY